MNEEKKVLGILGGMGPLATVDLYNNKTRAFQSGFYFRKGSSFCPAPQARVIHPYSVDEQVRPLLIVIPVHEDHDDRDGQTHEGG